ncbi:MAG: nitroreductase family deazaflavin-dependent oxidoreductase [Pseudomonadales bacterium]|nr:nitroreductase family deazaflavin-dependent oxidoreductase [Pseudomonadales bacterium]
MSDKIDLTSGNLLEGLAGEIRSPGGPGKFTRSFNQALIAEFRANNGVLTGELADSPFLLLTTTGSKSGKQRTIPLAHIDIDQRILVIASRGGAPVNPTWYSNLIAHPEVSVELGAETFPALAVAIEEPERAQLYANVSAHIPVFADYQRRTDRVIPIVELRRL